jgi:hypothetical protein
MIRLASPQVQCQCPSSAPTNNWHRRYLGVTTGRWRDFSKAAEVLMTDACAMIGINS